MNILEIQDLSVFYNTEIKMNQAVNKVSLSIDEGETLGIIGESGSGKTSIALAIMGLIDKPSDVKGKILYRGTNLLDLNEKEKNSYRWSRISIVFQNTLDILNPVLTIEEQILECIKRHTSLKKEAAKCKVVELMDMVELDSGWKHHYPHQLSGGMRQKVLIAMALACDPELLIVDEPTTALDAISSKAIISLLKKLQKRKDFSMIIISHELSVISNLTSNILVMYSGNILESGNTDEVIKEPNHTYTRGLINSSLEIYPFHDLWGIPAEEFSLENIKTKIDGCPFYYRCNQRIDICKSEKPKLIEKSLTRQIACNRGGIVTVLEGKNLSKEYVMHNKPLNACIDCNIKVRSGEVVVLMGQTGSGKTTLANILCGLLDYNSGNVFFEGEKIISKSATSKFNGIQIVFQDPFSATDSYMTVEEVIREPLDILKYGNKEERKKCVKDVLKQVQLDFSDNFLDRKCHSLSGGQRQRVAIARSLIMKPKLLIADEISTMLDPSTKANILRLLKGLQNENGFSMLYITHDLSLARKIADKVYVMHKGKIIEENSALEFFRNPKQEYSKMLLDEGLPDISYDLSTL